MIPEGQELLYVPVSMADNLHELRKERGILIGKLKNCEEKFNILSNEFENLEKKYSSLLEVNLKLRQDLLCYEKRLSLVDKHEVMITGIPTSVKLEPLEIIKLVLTGVGNVNLINQVIDVRECNKLDDSDQDTRTYIVQMSSSTSRDLFVSKATASAMKIFGSDYVSKINISAIWPKSVQELLSKAEKFAESHSLPKPVVRNLTVFMRKTNDQSQMIPILSEKHINS